MKATQKTIALNFLRLFMALSIFYGFSASAQTVILDEEVNVEKQYKNAEKRGENKTHKFGLMIGTGATITEDVPDFATKQSAFNVFNIGLYYKYKISGLLSVGTELNFCNNGYRLEKKKYSPDVLALYPPAPDRESLSQNYIAPSAFVRINFDPKRGNTTGKYIDLGATYHFKIGNSHNSLDKDVEGAKSEQVTRNGVDYLENQFLGVYARLGVRALSIFASYRLDPLLIPEKAPIRDFTREKREKDFDLPKLAVGIQLMF